MRLMVSKISKEQIVKELALLKNWHLDENFLVKDIEFPDFRSAVHFINHLADLAEKDEHHPDIHLTNYNQLQIRLTTHDADGLTEADFSLARKISELIAKEV